MKKDAIYWLRIKQKAKDLGSDGCTVALDFYQIACLEHDLHYRMHKRLDGSPITKGEADAEFRQAIQMRSKFGRASPMAAWRWLGVKLFGRRAWNRGDDQPVDNSPESGV